MANEPVVAQSSDAMVAAVFGSSTVGIGVHGQCKGGNPGVMGESDTGIGVHGTSRTNHAVHGESAAGRGVVGISQTFIGVSGMSTNMEGVLGLSDKGIGVHGQCKGGNPGVMGESDTGVGVHGTSRTNHAVHGESAAGRGVVGISQTFIGVSGMSTDMEGVLGLSDKGIGVHGQCKGGNPGVLGESNTGVGVHGKGGRLAGFFEGDVEVTGDIRLANADCAEDFNIGSDVKVEPGTVMVLGEKDTLFPSQRAYDKCVAGVISGAGDYKPGIVLDKQQSENNRQPIALLGKVCCKVDAQYGAIEVGDLLTTSPTPGHAMKTTDPLRAFGAVIGKALRPLTEGQGLIPILIALQ